MYMMIYKFLTWSACFSISLLFAWASLANFLKTSVWNSKHSQMQTFYRKVCVYINIIGHENHKWKPLISFGHPFPLSFSWGHQFSYPEDIALTWQLSILLPFYLCISSLPHVVVCAIHIPTTTKWHVNKQ